MSSLKEDIKKLKEEIKKLKKPIPKRKVAIKKPKRKVAVKKPKVKKSISVKQIVRVSGPGQTPIVLPGIASQPIVIPPPISFSDRVGDRVANNLMKQGFTAFENRPRQIPIVEVHPKPAQGITKGEAFETLISQMTPNERAVVAAETRKRISFTPIKSTPSRIPRPRASTSQIPAGALSMTELQDLIKERRNILDETQSELGFLNELIGREPRGSELDKLQKKKVAVSNRLNVQEANLRRLYLTLGKKEKQSLTPVTSGISNNASQLSGQNNPGLDSIPPRDNPVTNVVRQEDIDDRIAKLESESSEN